MTAAGAAALEIWASPEPSVARIDACDARDQGAETGWLTRSGDVDRIAELGVAGCRYPVLWEHVAPLDPERRDFRLQAAGAERLRERGVDAIVTLLHHGSGPRYTDLLDARFPQLFAAFARAAAQALPWVRRWTPINEPLTTARFSTLYGLWYPNLRDDVAFGRALVHQTLATLYSMEQIRAVIPDAQLVLTEDLQRFTAADRGAGAYVAFLRERAWLSIDLLAGRVVPGHALFQYLTQRCGLRVAELRLIQERAVAPDVLALDHYPHSERYIFSACDGSTGDVPAVYVRGEPPPRVAPLLRAAAERFALPLALGEVHVHAPADERVRWLMQHVADVHALRSKGVDIRALGIWAAFGMVDWHTLLRARHGISEDGIYGFAGSEGTPQPTALSAAVQSLTRGELVEGGATSGWWERDDRLRTPSQLALMQRSGVPEGDHVRKVSTETAAA